VLTYTADDMSAVTYESGRFGGSAQLRARSRFTIDGDALVCIPARQGEVDEALWAIHMDMTKQAQVNRVEMLKTAVSAAAGLLGALKAL